MKIHFTAKTQPRSKPWTRSCTGCISTAHCRWASVLQWGPETCPALSQKLMSRDTCSRHSHHPQSNQFGVLILHRMKQFRRDPELVALGPRRIQRGQEVTRAWITSLIQACFRQVRLGIACRSSKCLVLFVLHTWARCCKVSTTRRDLSAKGRIR